MTDQTSMKRPEFERGSNRAAVMTAFETIALEDRDVRLPGRNEAVVRPEAVGVCGSDTAYFTVGYIGDYVVDGPIILGHEASGVVVAVGDAVANVTVGDRVAIEPGTPCRNCKQCMAGRYHLCPSLEFLATPPFDGALQRFLTIDSRCLFRMPDTMSFEEGALLEPLSVGLWAAQRAHLQPGDDVLITGAGPVGILAAAAFRALGAGSVTITDIDQFRLGVASDQGFEAVHADSELGREFDVFIECSGAKGALASGLRQLREAGRVAMVGMSKEEAIPLPLSQLNPKELTISLVNRYAHTWPTAIELVDTGRIEVAHLVTHRFPLARTSEALLASRTHDDAIKAVVNPQE